METIHNPPQVAKIDQGYRAATMVPATVNDESRTVEVTFGTEAHVLRYDWMKERYFMEELGYKPDEVRMKRLTSGAAPVLDNHNSWGGARGTLGVVERAELNGENGTAVLRFSKRADVEPIYQDVLDGIIRTVSVGYRVHGYTDTGRKSPEGYPILRATDWEPMEISLAPIAADPDSRVRKDAETTYEVRIAGGAPEPTPAPKEETTAARAAQTPPKAGGDIQPQKRHKMKDVNEMKSRLAEMKDELVRLDNIAKNGGELTEEQETRQAALVGEIESLDGKIAIEERRINIITQRAKQGEGDFEPETRELRKMAKQATIGEQVLKIVDGKQLDGIVGELTRQAQIDGQTEVSGNGIAIPTSMIHALRAGTADNFQIDAGQGSAGKPTEVPGFIEKIFAPFLFEQMGATVLTGLVGKQQWPRQTEHGESVARTEVAATANAGIQIGDLIMDARRYTAKTTYSKKMLVQSPVNFDSVIAGLLRRAFERKFEKDCYVGQGNPEEVIGLFNQAGTNTPTIVDTTEYADIVAALYSASIRGEANPGTSQWVLSPNAWEMLTNAVKVTGVSALLQNGQLEGRPTATSPYLADPTTGTARMVFADFSQVYLGFWGSYDLVVDPYTLAETNQIKLVGNMYTDLGLANPTAISLNGTMSFT